MTVSIKSDLSRIKVYAKQSLQELPAAMARGCVRLSQESAGYLAASVQQKLTKRPTGALARSFKARLVTLNREEVVAEAISELPYAAIHDDGGTIRPTRGRMLAIPHRLASIPRGKGPRNFPKLVRIGRVLAEPIIKGPGKGRSGPSELRGWKPKFILAPSVRIKGVHYVEAAYNSLMAHFGELFDPELRTAIDAAETKANGVPRA